ncbi:MAG: SDR family oxidoreductase [Alphaproteobacteria bacterium]|jgi:NAD(P)-dependent dehydrogenase (short-subunit alcohol dehydrogenase family)|nr:SDR family oxidoreductase [Alphaproteobacteria bacterium]
MILPSPLSMFDVSGKSALVIGATGSFGSAAASALAQMGCYLTIADMNSEKLEALAVELRGGGAKVKIVAEIANSEAAAQKIIDGVVSAHGALDMMFVATGLNDVGYIEDQPYEKWRAVMTANLDGYWLACQAAGRQFAKQPGDRGRGKVVVVSSTRGRHGLPTGYTGYCASKAGLDGMVRALACEWGGKGININAIGPTVFRSPLSEWMFSEENPGKATREAMLERVPVGRLSDTNDLIGGLIYLLSPASDYVTGHTLYIDGGYTAE